jgi:PleD family two-component response regulator
MMQQGEGIRRMSKEYEKLRVMIVDDESFLRALIKNVLEQLGFRNDMIHMCSDGAEALSFLQDRKVDIVICDWIMKPMDGLTFVRVLRNPAETPAPGLPVILCSGKVGRESLNEILSAGVNEVIVKPITVGAIEKQIQAVLKTPRQVVDLANYHGPDRRRLSSATNQVERRAIMREYLGDPE